MSGRVFGADGRPLQSVCLNLLLKENPNGRPTLLDCTDEQGRYKIDEIPPGEYLIAVNADGQKSGHEPFPTVYYPGVFEKEKASPLTVTTGGSFEEYDIHVPSEEATRVIEGVLLYRDGRAAANELVEFKADAVRQGYDGTSRTKTDAQGRFSLTVLQGLKGRLRGYVITYEGQYENCPELEKLIKESDTRVPEIGTEPISLEVNSDYQGIKLVLPFPYCVKARVD